MDLSELKNITVKAPDAIKLKVPYKVRFQTRREHIELFHTHAVHIRVGKLIIVYNGSRMASMSIPAKMLVFLIANGRTGAWTWKRMEERTDERTVSFREA